MRKHSFAIGEFYHIYNRGVDKRDIFSDVWDMGRFYESMKEFNAVEPIGSMYERSILKKRLGRRASRTSDVAAADAKLVDFVSYCLNPNHYHFIITPLADRSVEKFMQRLGNGYTKYFNERYERSGALFQGRFQSVRVDSNGYLLHLSAYVNLNNRFKGEPPLLSKSSWEEYMGTSKDGICGSKNIVMEQFKGVSHYKKFAEFSLVDILERKQHEKEFKDLYFE